MAGSNRKKARTKKTSKHEHGGGGKLTTPLTDIQKVLMGKGMLTTIKSSDTKRAKRILAAKGHDKS